MVELPAEDAADGPTHRCGLRSSPLPVALLFALFILLAALLAPIAAAAVTIGPDSGIRFEPGVASVRALRDRGVVKQELDYSCGAAALATLLRYGFGQEVSERELVVELLGSLSETQKSTTRDVGFSLLDLQRVARARGFKSQAFRIEPRHLTQLAAPVIVYIEPRGYRHFAVLRGVRGDRVYLADPSRGNVRMPMHDFVGGWLQGDGRGIIFVVEPVEGLVGTTGSLAPRASGPVQPELMAVREMLAVGAPLVGRSIGRLR